METENGTSCEVLPSGGERRARVLSPGRLVFRRFLRNRLAITGLMILVLMFAFSFLGGVLSPYSQTQVFWHDEAIWKEFASGLSSTELRFTLAPDANVPEAAFTEAILAASRSESAFSYAGKTYSLVREGEDFYTLGEATQVAEVRTIANRFSITPADSSGALPPELAAAAEAAVEAKQAQFSAGGERYLVTYGGKTANVYRVRTVVLATKRVYDPGDAQAEALVNSFAFRYACETALANGQTAFDCDGLSYVLRQDGEETLAFAAEGGEEATPVCSISNFIVSPLTGDATLTAEFKAAFRAAIRNRETVFTLADASGAETEYRVERGNQSYTVRTLTSARLISIFESPSAAHPLGTDGNGMDVCTRLMYGGRISLMVGFVVVFLETLIGVALGGVSGYFGGWVDTAMMRFVDLFNCIPFYPLVLIVGAVMDKMEVDPIRRIFYLMALLGLLGWTNTARVVRGQILSLREQDFMLAEEAAGIRVSRRIFRHLLPNVMPLLIVQATLSLGGVIIAEATLSFLGLGVQYPLASWGSILNAATNVHVMTNYGFVWIPAGILIVLTVLGFNFIGDGLRDAFDPRMKR